jgi:cellulose synthase/poly-beta-1,6-N-acetylglucosamine synthase-like glycosyltransferase
VPRPFVSLGIPVYNGEPYLRSGLDTLLAQTYDHCEFIISDNASTDRTQEICLAYAARDPRVKYHRNPTNIGVIANYRRVLALSSGTYFMWAAADDVKPSTAVADCLAALERDPRAVMAHGVVQVRTAGSEQPIEYPNDVAITGARAAQRVQAFIAGMPHNAILYGLYRREALQRAVLGRCMGQDYLLTLQMCLVGPFVYTGTPIITYSERKAVASSSPMYTALPITLSSLFHAGKVHRRKCWTVLAMGIYYLSRMPGVSWSERWRAVVSHVSTFARLYHVRLAKEVIFQIFEPVAWAGGAAWRLGRRWSVIPARLAR